MTYTAVQLRAITCLIEAAEEVYDYDSDGLVFGDNEVVTPDGKLVGAVISNRDGRYEFRPVKA